MASPYLIGPASLPSTKISNTPRLSSMPEVSRDTLSVADTALLPSGPVSHVLGLGTSTGRGRAPRRPTGVRACRTARPGARRSSRGRTEAPRSGRRSRSSLSTAAYTHWPRAPSPCLSSTLPRTERAGRPWMLRKGTRLKPPCQTVTTAVNHPAGRHPPEQPPRTSAERPLQNRLFCAAQPPRDHHQRVGQSRRLISYQNDGKGSTVNACKPGRA
jgi:hypothetical protein